MSCTDYLSIESGCVKSAHLEWTPLPSEIHACALASLHVLCSMGQSQTYEEPAATRAMTLSNFGTGILQTKVHHLASWTSFLPCTRWGGWLLSAGNVEDSLKQLAFVAEWSMGWGGWNPGGWVCFAEHRRIAGCGMSSDIAHEPVYFAYINEPIWSRTSQISEAISLQTLKLSQQNTSNCLITLYLPVARCWPKSEHMIFDLTLGPGAAPACWSNSDYIWLVTMDVQQICWNCIAILELYCHCTSDVKSYLIYITLLHWFMITIEPIEGTSGVAVWVFWSMSITS